MQNRSVKRAVQRNQFVEFRNQLVENLTDFTKLCRNSVWIKKGIKRAQKQQDLYWFTLPQGLRLVSLATSKEIH